MEDSSTPAALERASIKDILVWGLEDWVDLAFARQYVSDEVGPVAPAQLREQTVEVVAQLLGSGLFVAGDLAEAGFVAWASNTAGTIARIREEWDVPEVTLHTGDVCWLQITETGAAVARRLAEADL